MPKTDHVRSGNVPVSFARPNLRQHTDQYFSATVQRSLSHPVGHVTINALVMQVCRAFLMIEGLQANQNAFLSIGARIYAVSGLHAGITHGFKCVMTSYFMQVCRAYFVSSCMRSAKSDRIFVTREYFLLNQLFNHHLWSWSSVLSHGLFMVYHTSNMRKNRPGRKVRNGRNRCQISVTTLCMQRLVSKW